MTGLFRSSNFIFVSGGVLLLLSGLWEFSGVPTFVVKGVFFLIIIGIMLVSLMQKKLTMPASHILILGAILALFAFSSLMYSATFVALSYFQIFAPIIVFLIAMSLSKSLNVARMEDFFLAFVFIQMLAALVKLAVIGQSEGGGIGTLSVQAGSVSTFLVFFICLIAMRRGAMGNQLLAYFLLFGALLFAIINEKRLGLLVVTGMSLMVIMWRDYRSNASFGFNLLRVRNAMRLMLAGLLAAGLLALGARFVPSLTEGFSLLTLAPRIMTYLMQTAGDGTPLGRLAGLFHIFGRLGGENGWIIGLGPMEFMSSNLTSVSSEGATFRATGFTILIARTGMAGLFIYSLFFLSLWRMSVFTMPVRLFVIYVFFDFLVYSDTLFVSHGVIFLLSLMLLRDRKLRSPDGAVALST